MPLKSFTLRLTPELMAALDDAAGDRNRTTFIESTLRKSAPVKRAAAKLGLEFQDRPPAHRPKAE